MAQEDPDPVFLEILLVQPQFLHHYHLYPSLPNVHAGLQLVMVRILANKHQSLKLIFIYAGAYLSLRGRVYANNSIFLVTDIGQSNNGLQCVIQNKMPMPCCMHYPYPVGIWVFPNGTKVPIHSSQGFYANSGWYNETIILNRLSENDSSPTGLFCCVVSEGGRTSQTLCANIGINVNILCSACIQTMILFSV